jgi:hypothetical protein
MDENDAGHPGNRKVQIMNTAIIMFALLGAICAAAGVVLLGGVAVCGGGI